MANGSSAPWVSRVVLAQSKSSVVFLCVRSAILITAFMSIVVEAEPQAACRHNNAITVPCRSRRYAHNMCRLDTYAYLIGSQWSRQSAADRSTARRTSDGHFQNSANTRFYWQNSKCCSMQRLPAKLFTRLHSPSDGEGTRIKPLLANDAAKTPNRLEI